MSEITITTLINRLIHNPDILNLSIIFNISPHEAVCKLIQFHGWAAEHAPDGRFRAIPGQERQITDQLLQLDGLTDALIALNYLSINEPGAIYIAGLDRSKEKLQRKRELTRLRVRAHRQRKKHVTHDVTLCNAKCNADVTHDVTLCNADVTQNVTQSSRSLLDQNNKPANKKKRKLFKPPTVDEVNEYARSIDFDLDGNDFVDYYTARNWTMNRGVKMSDWKAAVRNWKRRRNIEDNKRNNGQSPRNSTDRVTEQMRQVAEWERKRFEEAIAEELGSGTVQNDADALWPSMDSFNRH